MTTITVGLSSDRISDGALQQLTRSLNADLARHTDAEAEIKAEEGQAHHKGEPITMGMLLVTFMTSGTAVAVAKLLQSYLTRDRSLSLTVDMPDGRKVTLNAGNAGDADALAQALVGATQS